MPCLIKVLTKSAIKNCEKKDKTTNSAKNKNFTAKTQYLNLKAPCTNIKMQSDKTLAIQFYSFLTTQPMGCFLNDTRQQVDKKK